MKLTSPKDVCRSAAVCTKFQSVADLDDVWKHFLPCDLLSIFSRAEMSDHQLLLRGKELYLHLCHNWINLDGGLKVPCNILYFNNSGNYCFWLSAIISANSDESQKAEYFVTLKMTKFDQSIF